MPDAEPILETPAGPATQGPTPPRAVKRKVTPTTEDGAATGTFVPADVFYSFRGMADALSYWLPRGLNNSVATARTLRQLVR